MAKKNIYIYYKINIDDDKPSFFQLIFVFLIFDHEMYFDHNYNEHYKLLVYVTYFLLLCL